jgi:hypothetical protein
VIGRAGEDGLRVLSQCGLPAITKRLNQLALANDRALL